jgi:hypothetical protein
MKCKNCGFSNRKGVKFCEQCGNPLGGEAVIFCTNCGTQNRSGAKFCENCGAALAEAAAGAQTPPPPQAQAQAQQPPVVVIQQEGKKRKFNPALLLLILLLLILPACCLLMLFGQVETPAFAQAFIDPVVEQVREQVRQVLPGLPWPPHDDNNMDGKEPEPCEELADIAKNIKDLEMDCEGVAFDTKCRVTFYSDNLDYFLDKDNEFPELWKPTSLDYKWKNGQAGNADCYHNTIVGGEHDGNAKVTCDIPKDPGSDHVDLHLVVEDCTEYLHGEDFAQGGGAGGGGDQETCCSNVEADNVDYFRDPPEVGTLYLGFDLTCTTRWDLDAGECAEFNAFVGADTDIYWATGECCPDEDNPYNLVCEAPLENQKNSKTRIALRYGDSCELEVYFQSPYYAPKTCPPGQSMCAGRCCSIGHCCTCGGVLGCYEDCSSSDCS